VITTRVLTGFEDPSFSREEWDQLLAQGCSDVIALTWSWQKSWWDCYGKGKLLLILALRDGRPEALAPLFADKGMVFNLYIKETLDFIGDTRDPEVIMEILKTAREQVESFHGFRFYFIPETSSTFSALKQAAGQLGYRFYDEGTIPSPYLEVAAKPEEASKISRKKSLRSHENYFLREGQLEVLHLDTYREVNLYFEDFIEQHVRRRSVLPDPSPLADAQHRAFYTALMKASCERGWFLFTRVGWNGKAIAYAYSFVYKGRYLFLITSFNLDLVDHSPGEVLLKNLLAHAIQRRMEVFDFGIGDEAYKYRFSTAARSLHTLGLYPEKSQAI
jgi:CelD/BcsL family acetyltransferase involved in cellulose biosynthesis